MGRVHGACASSSDPRTRRSNRLLHGRCGLRCLRAAFPKARAHRCAKAPPTPPFAGGARTPPPSPLGWVLRCCCWLPWLARPVCLRGWRQQAAAHPPPRCGSCIALTAPGVVSFRSPEGCRELRKERAHENLLTAESTSRAEPLLFFFIFEARCPRGCLRSQV